ncbi:glycosyltransferase family 4 protein [Micromonosporaceae bacterium Da 78-11]
MHIALVHRDLHQLTRGGICTLYRSLAAQLTARGMRVSLITQDTAHPVHLDGVTVHTLPRTDDLIAHRRGVAAALDQIKPDIVECSTWEAEALAYLESSRPNRAPVVVRGEFSAATLGAEDLAADERQLVHLADRVIAVSSFAAHDLESAYAVSAPQVVPNGVDRSLFNPGPPFTPKSGYRVTLDPAGLPTEPTPIPTLLSNGHFLPPWTPDQHGRSHLIWIGKITPMKGWDLLERVIRRLASLATVTVLLGHSRAYTPVTIDSNADLTVLHDLDDADLPGFYRSADWLLSTSRWEGFGLAIAEALACGTPVLLPEALGTAPELLASGGGYTYRDPDHLATILTTRTRPTARIPECFDWGVNAETTLSIYRDLIETRNRPCASC